MIKKTNKKNRIALNDERLLRQHCYVNGKWIEAENGKTIDIINPATDEILGTVPKGGASEVSAAIAAAAAIWPSWRSKTAIERADILQRWCALMLESREDLARIMTAEQGKPLAEARGEIGFAASFIRWFAEECRRVYGDIIPSPWPHKKMIVTREPVGVVGIITPWNFPTAMIARKASAALAVGCTVVIKPASQTPFSALAMAELAERAGVPAGVFNVVTGSAAEIADEMTSSPLVRKISFTGSTEIGKDLMQKSAKSLKKLSMELGGNAPFLIFEDADLELAVQNAMASKFRNTGQTCICVNRFYAHNSIYDRFIDMLRNEVTKLNVGNGMEEGVTQGPLIDKKVLKKVEQHVTDARAKGGKVIIGGKRHALRKTFYEPTIIANASDNMACASEETFGPVAPVFRFSSEDEAISNANNTPFGLAAYVFTKDLGRAWRVSEALQYGLVGVNESIISSCEAPFGGVKESGFGREGSRYGVDDYTVLKYTCMAGLSR